MEKYGKIDLSLLKKFLNTFEAQLDKAESIGQSAESKDELQNYVLELSKSLGLISGLIQESTLLVLDVQGLMKLVQQSPPSLSKSVDALDAFFGMKHSKTTGSGEN